MTSQTPQTLIPDGSDRSAGSPPTEEVPPAKTPGRRRAVWVAPAGALVLLAAAAGGYYIATGTDSPGQSSTGATPSARPVATTSGSATPSPAGRETGSPSLTASLASSPATDGRNPFQVPAGAVGDTTGSGPTTGAADGVTSSGSSGSGGSGGSGSDPAVTVTATPSYVGLYEFSGSKATFWVNDTRYQVSEGSSFGGFIYSEKTSSSCAKVTSDGTSTTICVGTVKQLG